MKSNNYRSWIFVFLLIVVMITCTYFVFIKKDEQADYEDKMTLSAEDMSNLDDTSIDEQESLLAERESYRNECIEIEKADKEYHKGKYGVTYNKDFVKEETLFRSIDDMVEYEFLDYEEIDNLNQYIEQANKDIESGKTTETYHDFEKYIREGKISEDGAFIPQRSIIQKRNGVSGELGEKIINENAELVAIKIKVRYKNLSVHENEISYRDLHNFDIYVYGEDNELYQISNVYSRNLMFEFQTPIYTTMAERYLTYYSPIYGESVSRVKIKLEPLEEYIGELIYIVPKAELDNVAFCSSYALNGDSTNYKDIGTNIVFASYLREKFAK